MLTISKDHIEKIAHIAHEANRVFCLQNGDDSHKSWRETEEGIRETTREGVRYAFENPGLTPEQSHANWCESKKKAGYTYGKVKDNDKKTHPNLCSFGDLSSFDRTKDALFINICNAYFAGFGLR